MEHPRHDLEKLKQELLSGLESGVFLVHLPGVYLSGKSY